jgi:hypothetical protein
MGWSSEREYKAVNGSAPCWSCAHCQRRFNIQGAEHRCEIARQGFPEIGRHCAAFLPAPGARIEAA